MTEFYAPIIPYNLTEAINRMALATGSLRGAAAGASADFNGHYVTVSFNTYRNYYVAEYMWAGRVVLARGTLAACVAAAMAEYRRGAKGAMVAIKVREEDVLDTSSFPELVCGSVSAYNDDLKANAPWWATEVGFAVSRGYTHHLHAASSKQEFEDLCFPSLRKQRA